MPSASFTVADILDRGIAAVPDVFTSLPDEGVATRADVDGIVRSAFSEASPKAFDRDLLDGIIVALDPLARATAVISAKYAELGGAGGILGATSGAVADCMDGFGFYRHFRNGSIFWHPAAGAHEVHGAIRAKWAALGWERSVLGYPTSDQIPGSDADQRGAYNTFQGGAIHWYPPGFGGLLTAVDVGVLEVAVSAAGQPSRLTGRVGLLTTAAVAASDAQLTVMGEAAGGAATVATPMSLDTASRVVALDGAAADVATLLGRFDEIGGRTAVVSDGPTVLGSAAGAFEVHGEIGVHYRALGGSGSVLGYPTTDETGTPDGMGRYNHFQAGSIYWTPGTGAHEVHGLIRSFWAAGGWERNNALGYPISDELIPDRRIGHVYPERKKKALGLPPDIVKLPADAVFAGFAPNLTNLPVGEVIVANAPTREVAPRIVRAAGARRIADAVTAEVTPAMVALPAASARLTDVVAGPIDGARLDMGILRPQPSSTPGPVASVNRFGDFENGVVFWRRGASAARQLQPWATSADGNSMKRSPAEVATAFDGLLSPALAGLHDATYAGSTFLGTTGYTYDGATVHNRAHRVNAALMAQQSIGGVFGGVITLPTMVSVELRLETAFDPDRRAVVVYLAGWSYADAASLTASPPLLRQLHPRLDGLLYKRVDLIDIPDTDGGDPIALLSAKTLPDGSVVVYIEPDDQLVVSAGFKNINEALGTGVVLHH